MRPRTEWRLLSLGLLAAGVLLLLVVRAVDFALIQHAVLLRAARGQQTDQLDIPARRGTLYDRCGRPLACTLENPSLAARFSAGADRAATLAAAVEAGLCSGHQAREIASASRTGFFWLRRTWVSSTDLARLPRDLEDVEQILEMKRFYPAGPVAPQLLGSVGIDGQALSGIEQQYDAWLAGRPGRKLQFVTGGGRPQNAPPAQVLREPTPGGGIVLTLDRQIQEITRHRLLEGMEKVSATEGTAIVVDPWTGAILALVEEPSGDPQLSASPRPEELKLRSVHEVYEPGSVFKIVPLSAGLDAGRISPADVFFCCHGERVAHGCRIRDLKKFGDLSVAEILVHSSNIGAGLIAEHCGWELVCGMAQRLGFGLSTGVGLGGEATGHVPHPLHHRWSARSLATLAYGQEVSCSALQLVMAYAAIANGGELMSPLLVSARVDARGQVVERFTRRVVRRVMTTETAETVAALLRRVVTEGTAKAAEVPHYPTAGKTGTAQVTNPSTGAYFPDQHILTFVGFAPYERPRCVCLVALRTARAGVHAGDAAAPVFGRIVRDLVWVLEHGSWDTRSTESAESLRVAVPDVRGLTPEAARLALHRSGLVPVLAGAGERVVSLDPAPYAFVPGGSRVCLSLGGNAAHARVCMPAVQGLALRRALALLTAAGLTADVRGCGWVVVQDPPAGSDVEAGTPCLLTASPEASQARCEALKGRSPAGAAASFGRADP